MMLGDQRDLADLMSWASTFWNVDEDRIRHWSDDMIGTVSWAILELCSSFDAAGKAHRLEFGLTNKKDEKVGLRANPESFR